MARAQPLPDSVETATVEMASDAASVDCPAVRLDQVIPTLASRDAIGVHTVALRDALRRAGTDSDIFYGTCTPDMADQGRPVGELGGTSPDRWLLYQISIGSPVFDTLMARPEPKIVNYHNITPAALLASWEPEVARQVELGRRQLAALATESTMAVCDSAFNETELLAAGYRHTAVVPLLIDVTAVAPTPDPAVAAQLRRAKHDGGADLLFVGKIAPHKAPHDLVLMLAALHRAGSPRARLHLVGSPLGATYARALAQLIDRLHLGDAIVVTGSVSPAALEAYYQAADVFVCASDHEGFCVPLVEAMGHRLPVVAYGAGAVPETVGHGGLVLFTKRPAVFATAVHRVLSDLELRRRLVDAAGRRVDELGMARSATRFVEILQRTMDS